MLTLIGIASNRDWKPRMGLAFGSLMAHSISKGISVLPVVIEQCYLHEARNKLVRVALESRADYVFFMDDDLVFPADALERLVAHDKDIIGPVYCQRNPPHVTLGNPLDADVHFGLGKMNYIPGGLMLMKIRIFSKMKPPWFKFKWRSDKATKDNPDGTIGEDVGFCWHAREKGFEVWCDYDLSYECTHLGESHIRLQRPSHERL